MTDLIWVITSSILILAVIAVRAILGKKMNAGLRYALWALVLLRLLIPGTVFSSPVSVSTAAEKTEVVQNFEAVRGASAIEHAPSGEVHAITFDTPSRPAERPQAPSAPVVSTVVDNATPERFERMKKTLELRDVLRPVWFIGMGVTAALFIFINVRFYLTLRKNRRKLDIACSRPVYTVENLASSCLFFGTIYICADTAKDEAQLRYVLEHEKAHFRHGDHFFTLLRSAALVLHWYNPLVWWAAALSRQDSELFADAGALARLGEDERENYGMTLISLSARRPIDPPVLSAATAMTNGKRELKERIRSISKKRKMSFIVLAAVLVLAAIAVFCTFAGCEKKPTPEPGGTPVTEEPTAGPTAEPTTEPTEAPTPEPTAVPMPAAEWMLDEALPYAELANNAYGFGYSRETAEVVRNDETDCMVVFKHGSDPTLQVNFRPDRSGSWYISYNDFLPGSSGGFGEMDWNWPEPEGLDFSGVTVTSQDLVSIGHTPDGSVNDCLAAARWCAQKVAQSYEKLPENNVFRCLEADPGEPYVYAMPVMPGEAVSIQTKLYFLPSDVRAFLNAALEVYPCLAGPDQPYPGRVQFGLPLTTKVIKTSAGWQCSMGFNSSAEIEPGWNYPAVDAMGYLTYYTDCILQNNSANTGGSEGTWFIRFLYGMDWNEYGSLYTLDQWNRLSDLIKTSCIAQEQIPQVYMDKHLMLGCLNAGEDYWPGLGALLETQRAYDREAFDQALGSLSEDELIKINAILEQCAGSEDLQIFVEESGYRWLSSEASWYLESEHHEPAFSLRGNSEYVFFNLEEDGLKAYERKYTRQTRVGQAEWKYEFAYTDLLAVYPREVGELANRRLIEYAREYLYMDIADDANLIDQGFIGDDWFTLVTLDDSMQDLQAHCIFYNDGGNWIEIGANNGAVRIGGGLASFPLTGACVLSKDEAIISVYSKFLVDEQTGFTRPYVYRTEDGGATWQKLDIVLPDYFLPANGGRICPPLQAFFRGNIVVMPLGGLDFYESAWLESADRGRTWEFRFSSLMDYPVD